MTSHPASGRSDRPVHRSAVTAKSAPCAPPRATRVTRTGSVPWLRRATECSWASAVSSWSPKSTVTGAETAAGAGSGWEPPLARVATTASAVPTPSTALRRGGPGRMSPAGACSVVAERCNAARSRADRVSGAGRPAGAAGASSSQPAASAVPSTSSVTGWPLARWARWRSAANSAAVGCRDPGSLAIARSRAAQTGPGTPRGRRSGTGSVATRRSTRSTVSVLGSSADGAYAAAPDSQANRVDASA